MTRERKGEEKDGASVSDTLPFVFSKRFPCVLSKRSRVCRQKCSCHTRHGHFGGTHGNVLNHKDTHDQTTTHNTQNKHMTHTNVKVRTDEKAEKENT